MNDEYDDFEGLFDDLNEDDYEYEGSFDDEFSDLDDKYYHEAFINSYDILTEKVTLDQLIQKNYLESDGITTLIHDATAGPTKLELETILEYFEESEEYEKCAEIYKMIKEY
tara:strand:+ start:1346 stop:1681 length:336 start_codon:yes stop_codon:yes gene_type:complete